MKRSKRIFSWSIFLASFKSNYISYLVVTFGNALILFILVLILSSLTINATRQSMSNLFNSANMERQMKEGAVSLYLSYDEGIQLYNDEMPLLGEYSPLLYESFVTIMELNTGKYDLALNTIKITYDGLYSSPLNNGETIEEKHAYAISETINLVNTFIPLFNLDDSINDFLPYFISDFLDEYSLNNEMSNKELIKGSIKNSIDDYLKNKFDFENENIGLINESIDKLLVVENKDELIEDMQTLADGLKLLQADYLGGNGTRGYGRVSFEDLNVKQIINEDNQIDINEIESIFKGNKQL